MWPATAESGVDLTGTLDLLVGERAVHHGVQRPRFCTALDRRALATPTKFQRRVCGDNGASRSKFEFKNGAS
jgi:hypothetical protein